MTDPKRDINHADYSDGTEYAGVLDPTINWLSGLNLGRLANLFGINDLTATLNELSGFSAWSDDAFGTFVAYRNNTGAMTLQIEDQTVSPATSLGGQIPIRNNKGEALEADDVVQNKVYPFQYNAAEAVIRLLVNVPSQEAGEEAISLNRQEFLSSGTWQKPSGLVDGAMVLIELWGGGGGGRTGVDDAGGGGGAYVWRVMDAADLGDTETVTIGAGGSTASSGGAGGNSTFGSHLTAYGGGGGGQGGGGGGGALSAGTSIGGGSESGGAGGGPAGGAGVGTGGTGNSVDGWGGGGGGGQDADGGDSGYGGGGGGGANATSGGDSVYGGAGGGGATGGTSIFGGNGGNAGVAGSAPGGGGGGTAAGGAGKCLVRVLG